MLHVYRQISGQHRVEPWAFTHKRECADRFPFPAKRVVVLPKSRLRWWRRLVARHLTEAPWRLYRWEVRHALLELTRAEAQLLHVYFGHSALHLLPLIKAWPRPVVVSFHGADAGVDMDKPKHLAALREVFAAATALQARSASLRDDLVALGAPKEKIHLQRTGIPLEEWPFVAREAPADGKWVLIQSCRFIDKKGLDTTLRAFALVLRQCPKAHLLLVGDGPLRTDLESLAVRLDVRESVTFTGFLHQEDLRQQVYAAHAFVHPSRTSADGNREGVPNSMLEAMASGTPVVATRHGGIPEAIAHGTSGLLVNEDDHETMADALTVILHDREHARGLAEGGRSQVEKHFDRARNILQLEDLYFKLIAH
ncbi:MAG: glycosyltransferase [Roseimicrobium sp.]